MQEIAKMDVDDIMAKQVEQLEKEKKELQEKLKGQEKKVRAIYMYIPGYQIQMASFFCPKPQQFACRLYCSMLISCVTMTIVCVCVCVRWTILSEPSAWRRFRCWRNRPRVTPLK